MNSTPSSTNMTNPFTQLEWFEHNNENQINIKNVPHP